MSSDIRIRQLAKERILITYKTRIKRDVYKVLTRSLQGVIKELTRSNTLSTACSLLVKSLSGSVSNRFVYAFNILSWRTIFPPAMQRCPVNNQLMGLNTYLRVFGEGYGCRWRLNVQITVVDGARGGSGAGRMISTVSALFGLLLTVMLSGRG